MIPPAPDEHRAGEVFRIMLGLGLTSFGGPIAHLGYFERAFVRQRQWLTAHEYAGLVALCQMLPGPASSQVGLLVGLRRAGWPGALAAWAGFTLPSAFAMFAFALCARQIDSPAFRTILHGLQLVAVAVVAQAVWSMARTLCPDTRRTALALAAACLMLVEGGARTQIAALAAGALGGILLCRNLPALPTPPPMPLRPLTGVIALAAFLLLAAASLAWPLQPHSLPALAGIFYQAGALVFGGGHVVLPLLRDALVPAGWLPNTIFLAGYGAAQAVPGPLFTFAAYLGAILAPPGSQFVWSATALAFIYLPGILVALAGLPLWTWVARHNAAKAALAGVNAAVVGLLGAALYDPVWTSAIHSARDVAIALTAFLLLDRWRLPPFAIVAFCVAATQIP
jgi:chromate transporter